MGDDDIVTSPIWLADILTAEGLVGTFVLQARRAEILAEGKRADVIAALRRHEIGLHGRDIHPVIPEIVEDLDWPKGVAALLDVEGSELALLGRVFDVEPVCSSQHRNYGAPQLFGVARHLGMPYLFGTPCVPPTNSLSWFAGALNVPFNSPVPEFLGFFPAVFDDVLGDDREFEQLFAQLQRHVARCLEVKLPLLVVFTCHPERLAYRGPLEQWRYGNGQNHPVAQTPPDAEIRRSRAEVARGLTNFRRLVRYLRDTPGLVPTTVRDVVRRIERPNARIPMADLLELAESAVREHQIAIGQTLSAADTIVGLAEALIVAESTGKLPESVARLDVLGPSTSPPLVPALPALPTSRLIGLARDLLECGRTTGHLPASLAVDDRDVGLATLYGAFAGAVLAARQRGTLVAGSVVPLEVWPRYPTMGEALSQSQRLSDEDPLVRPGLRSDAAALHMRLQSWTLKPAVI